MILIKNSRVVDKKTDDYLDVLIDKGKIIEVNKEIKGDFQKVIDCKGKTLMPAFTDLHVHFRDPGFTYKEDLYSGSKSAIKGGFTTVNLMANTNPICSTKEIYNNIINKSKNIDFVDIYQSVSVTKNFDGENIVDFSEFDTKIFSDDGFSIENSYIMYKALKESNEANKIIFAHIGDNRLAKIDYRLAEDLMTIRDIELCKALGTKMHLCHISTKGAISSIIKAKKEGVSISVGVTPHHIALSDNNFKVNPPIRTKEDNIALINAIKEGMVDIIETDHAPHSLEDKLNGAPGLIGLETSFCVSYTTLVRDNNIDIKELSKLMSYNPSIILGINKGLIKEGYIADLVLVDLEKEILIDSNKMVSKSKNTPFDNMKFFGEILFTMKAGVIKYDNR